MDYELFVEEREIFISNFVSALGKRELLCKAKILKALNMAFRRMRTSLYGSIEDVDACQGDFSMGGRA